MLVVATVVVPLLVGAFAARMVRRRRARAALAGAGVIIWVGVLVYAVAIHACRPDEHCDTGFLWFFGLFALFGWLIGLVAGARIGRAMNLRAR